ncbi:hypothetical protein V6O07_17495, partial [Arthrospira platensis SPKY2]
HSTLGFEYIPNDGSTFSHDLSSAKDGIYIQTIGTNTIYFRTIDRVGNFSPAATYRTAPIEYGGESAQFAVTCSFPNAVRINPNISQNNLFTINWDPATPAEGR